MYLSQVFSVIRILLKQFVISGLEMYFENDSGTIHSQYYLESTKIATQLPKIPAPPHIMVITEIILANWTDINFKLMIYVLILKTCK